MPYLTVSSAAYEGYLDGLRFGKSEKPWISKSHSQLIKDGWQEARDGHNYSKWERLKILNDLKGCEGDEISRIKSLCDALILMDEAHFNFNTAYNKTMEARHILVGLGLIKEENPNADL